MMPKNRPSPGRCIHCLNSFELLTWDHVLPESWYPDGSEEYEKWKAPACEPCNCELSKLEEGLLTKLGLCLDPKDIKSLGIPKKVLRSLDPSAGRDQRDREYRAKKRAKVSSGITVTSELPKQGILPNFGPDPHLRYTEYGVLHIYEGEISRIADKLIRGIAYIADGSFIEDSHEIKTFPVEESKVGEIRDLIEHGGVIFDRPPGLTIKRHLMENERVGGLYRIEIWGRFILYVTVGRKDLSSRA